MTTPVRCGSCGAQVRSWEASPAEYHRHHGHILPIWWASCYWCKRAVRGASEREVLDAIGRRMPEEMEP